MFGLGPAEIILVFIIALIVFGPGRLPEIGQQLGKTLREFRDASKAITQDLTRELKEAERDARGVAKPPTKEKVHKPESKSDDSAESAT
jgi:TatA/E family protein of Tat protein translocase